MSLAQAPSALLVGNSRKRFQEAVGFVVCGEQGFDAALEVWFQRERGQIRGPCMQRLVEDRVEDRLQLAVRVHHVLSLSGLSVSKIFSARAACQSSVNLPRPTDLKLSPTASSCFARARRALTNPAAGLRCARAIDVPSAYPGARHPPYRVLPPSLACC